MQREKNMSKVKGLIKSIIGTDAIVAVDANGNERSLKAGDVIYDNEVIKEQDGVKVELQSLNSENEKASDEANKEIASLQEQLLNGKISLILKRPQLAALNQQVE